MIRRLQPHGRTIDFSSSWEVKSQNSGNQEVREEGSRTYTKIGRQHMVTMCAQLFWLFYETLKRWDGIRGENTKGKLFVFSEMILRYESSEHVSKWKETPKRKGQQKKKIKIRETYLLY